jgi:hypothetical protein
LSFNSVIDCDGVSVLSKLKYLKIYGSNRVPSITSVFSALISLKILKMKAKDRALIPAKLLPSYRFVEVEDED